MEINGYKSRAAALRDLRDAGYKISGLLATPEANPKLAKNGLKGVYSRPLHLAPARLSGFNTCAQASAGCIKACLHTAGNPAYMEQKQKSRIAKTRAYFDMRLAFMAVLGFEIAATVKAADKRGMQAAIRLNATSDIPFERIAVMVGDIRYPSLIDLFPEVEFYDYTKITKRALAFAENKLPVNYHLTFSKSEENDADAQKILDAGGNVAIVFNCKDIRDQALIAAKHGFNAPLVNADEHDFRPLDGKGVIAALYAKGKAKHDTSGFVLKG